jgi:hypothetical protein
MGAAWGWAAVLAKVRTCAVVGLEGELVVVEVDIAAGGLPQFLVVGLPDDAVKEARERGVETVCLPAADAAEAALRQGAPAESPGCQPRGVPWLGL